MLKLKNLSKFYYSKGIIASGLNRVNLELHPGEFVVITGESGSGKSTLINVISGLDSYEEGEMYIDGNETSHFTVNDFENYRRKYIANIFQSFNLVSSYTVFQNVELVLLVEGRRKSDVKEKVSAIIEKVGLTEFANTKVSKLSGGQKQRVAIARALAKETPIIVADEPTGNLDSKSALGIVQLLKDVAEDHLVIVVTHNYDQFEDCASRRIKLSDGRIIEDEVITPRRDEHKIAAVETKPMTWANKFILGIRNTFNIFPKFLLLLLVFLFLSASVIFQYAGIKANNDAFEGFGTNMFFSNSSDRRVVIKHSDNSPMTEKDYDKLKDTPHYKTLFKDDIILDVSFYSIDDNPSEDAETKDQYNVYMQVHPAPMSEMPKKLLAGEKPKADNEAVIGLYSMTLDEDALKGQVGKEVKLSDNAGEEYSVKVTGVYFIDKQKTNTSAVEIDFEGVGKIFLSDSILSKARASKIDSISKTEILINGKKYPLGADGGQFNVYPNANVAKGYAIVPEEVDALYESGSSRWRQLVYNVKNIYFKDTTTVVSVATYTKNNYKNLLGIDKPFEDISGNIYINDEEYNSLFMKENYQSTVYIDERKNADEAVSWLKDNGYTVVSLAKAKTQFIDTDILNIVTVPLNVAIVVGIFFICYFVIRLILRSRSTYFSTLRLICLDIKSIKQILDIELIFIINIAYFILVAFIRLVQTKVLKISFLVEIFDFIKIQDYIILYVIVVCLAYIISRKFSKKLFKKSAMSTFREEV
ncbi:MAG: ABC transporter ATP-binding protein [Clostridiales bacterium]|nr:ABC transporter ATP-binding protein [Clostridiales bacterium]MDY6117482.1 ABC transporter ATP-binding protein [Anaerovoracaceae bacterium]